MTIFKVKHCLTAGVVVTLLNIGGLSGQDHLGDANSLLRQRLPNLIDSRRDDLSARRIAVQEGWSRMPGPNTREKLPMPTVGQQKELKQFVRKNHPELIRLLNWLETNRPEQYEKAIKSLAQSHNRLLMIQKRDPERYESALEQWNLRSRIQFTAAQLALKDSPRLRQQLEELVRKQVELRTAQLKQEAARAGQRLVRIQAQIERLDSNFDEVVDREMRTAIRNANQMKRGLNAVKKPKENQKSDQETDDS